MSLAPLYISIATVVILLFIIATGEQKVDGLSAHDRIDVHQEILIDFVRQFNELREKQK